VISPQVLGSKVDLFIRGATPLRSMESDVVERLVGEMEAAGISIVRGEAEAISGDAASKTVVLKDGKGEHGGYGQVLFATGREPVPARTSAAPRLHLGRTSASGDGLPRPARCGRRDGAEWAHRRRRGVAHVERG
jgi:hypothetical protein